MKKWTKSVLVTVLSAVFLLGCMGTAWAIDGNSNFADASGASDSGISSFYLIKDYDSASPTGNTAPNSISPQETFIYTITPYHVWNAGSTYDGSGTGTATQITTGNMPMLEKVSPLPSGISGVTYDDTTTSKTLIVKQEVGKNQAEYVASASDETFDNDNRVPINLPTYATVGDYWYKVVESIGNTSKPTTGVLYGTNDARSETLSNANGYHNATYYIHVQVTQGTSGLIRNVTLHKNSPDQLWTNEQYNSQKSTVYGVGTKVNAIENKYYAGQLQVKKIVAGNSGDKSQYFQVRVTFTKPQGTVINSDIAISNAFYNTATTGTTPIYATDNSKTILGQYANGDNDPAAGTLFKWDKKANSTDEAKAVVEFFVTNNTVVTFSNIPCGINYTVEEYTTGDLGYTNSFAMKRGTEEMTYGFNGNTLTHDDAKSGSHFCTNNTTDVGAEGSITGPNADLVTITNQKEIDIDIGVITENAPYIAMLAVSGAALFLLFLRKKNPSEV